MTGGMRPVPRTVRRRALGALAGLAALGVAAAPGSAAQFFPVMNVDMPAGGATSPDGPAVVQAAMTPGGAGTVAYAACPPPCGTGQMADFFAAQNSWPRGPFSQAGPILPQLTAHPSNPAWQLGTTSQNDLVILVPRYPLPGAGGYQAIQAGFGGALEQLDPYYTTVGASSLAVAGPNALAAFVGTKAGVPQVLAAAAQPDDGDRDAFPMPDVVGPAAAGAALDAGVSVGGGQVVVWDAPGGGLASAVGPVGGEWDPLPAIARSADLFALDVAPGGAAALAWTDGRRVVVNELPAGGTAWGAPQVVATTVPPTPSSPTPEVTHLDVAAGPTGTVGVAWAVEAAADDPGAGPPVYGVATSPAGTTWSTPVLATDPEAQAWGGTWAPSAVEIELDGVGNGVAGFSTAGSSGGGNPYYVTASSAGGPWSGLIDLTQDDPSPTVPNLATCDSGAESLGSIASSSNGILVAVGCVSAGWPLATNDQSVIVTTFR